MIVPSRFLLFARPFCFMERPDDASKAVVEVLQATHAVSLPLSEAKTLSKRWRFNTVFGPVIPVLLSAFILSGWYYVTFTLRASRYIPCSESTNRRIRNDPQRRISLHEIPNSLWFHTFSHSTSSALHYTRSFSTSGSPLPNIQHLPSTRLSQ